MRETSKKIGARVERAASRRLAGMAGEAVPLAGIAIITGFALLDVMDTCATLVELDDLSAGDPGIRKSAADICRRHVPTTSEIRQEVVRGWKKALDAAKNQLPSPGNIPPPDVVVQRLVDGISKAQSIAAGN